MDIQIPHSALRRYLDTNAKPTDIARCLSLCGPTVDRLETIDHDFIYHIEVITNRIDAASAYGIAREAAAILPEFNFQAKLLPPDLSLIKLALNREKLPDIDLEIVNNFKLNPRIMAIKISNVTVSLSEAWLVDALEKFGQRSLNNLIDITNFVMFELGHPVHVFDFDRLSAHRLIVREAVKDEAFITLDGQKHICLGGEVVYDDGTGQIVDLPGIMGTQNSVVTENTKTALIWIEANDRLKIRQTSLKHQLRTHAAILNEKGVDPELIPISLKLAAQLTLKLTPGKVASKILDLYPKAWKPHTVTIAHAWLEAFAGITLNREKVSAILNRLDFQPKFTEGLYQCQVPSHRNEDINIPQDLAEEILRIYGYYKLPSHLPSTMLPANPIMTPLDWEYDTKLYLSHLGFTEIYNNSLISQSLVDQYHLQSSAHFKLLNPLSDEFLYMRPAILPSLIQNYLHQPQPRSDINIFELSHIYQRDPQSKLALEIPCLGLISSSGTFSSVKGFIEAIARKLHLKLNYHALSAKDHPPVYFKGLETALIKLESTVVGYVGQLNLDSIYAVEINFSLLAAAAHSLHHFQPLNPYPAIIEDLTFTLPPKTEVGPILSFIPTVSPLLQSPQLKSVYHLNYTFTLHYQHPQKQLTVSEITPLRLELVQALAKCFNTELVGKLP